jgi:hypothetical protein
MQDWGGRVYACAPARVIRVIAINPGPIVSQIAVEIGSRSDSTEPLYEPWTRK